MWLFSYFVKDYLPGTPSGAMAGPFQAMTIPMAAK
jgi:hypothetical protein